MEAGTEVGEPIRFDVRQGEQRYAMWVFNIGLACCAVEFVAASMSQPEPGDVDAPRTADVVVISGTITDKMAPAIKRLYDALPEPRYVLSFGACSNSGGPYWDSYSVTKGVDQLIPVDVYVPGCPPRPEALRHGLAALQEKIAARSS